MVMTEFNRRLFWDSAIMYFLILICRTAYSRINNINGSRRLWKRRGCRSSAKDRIGFPSGIIVRRPIEGTCGRGASRRGSSTTTEMRRCRVRAVGSRCSGKGSSRCRRLLGLWCIDKGRWSRGMFYRSERRDAIDGRTRGFRRRVVTGNRGASAGKRHRMGR